MGIKDELAQMIKEQQRTNELLAALIAALSEEQDEQDGDGAGDLGNGDMGINAETYL